jgi:hypothetical protein
LDPRARSAPARDAPALQDADAVTNAFRSEWTDNPDDEILKQVVGYFEDSSDEFTTKRPAERAPPVPATPPPFRATMSRGREVARPTPSKPMKIPNNYHPFSGFYYKNKFNNS